MEKSVAALTSSSAFVRWEEVYLSSDNGRREVHYYLKCRDGFSNLAIIDSDKYGELMKKYFGDQPSEYWHFLKEVEGVTGILMVMLMAIVFTLATPWFRQNKLSLPKPLKKLTRFNAFWYSRHLFVIVYTLLIVHGIKLYLAHGWYKKMTWMYLAVPIMLYAGECCQKHDLRPLSFHQLSVPHLNVAETTILQKPNSAEQFFALKA